MLSSVKSSFSVKSLSDEFLITKNNFKNILKISYFKFKIVDFRISNENDFENVQIDIPSNNLIKLYPKSSMTCHFLK